VVRGRIPVANNGNAAYLGPRVPERDAKGEVRVNLLAFIGAILGLCSAFMPWRWLVNPFVDFEASLAWDFVHFDMVTNLVFLVGGLLFLIGSLLSIFRTIGAFVQVSGVIVYSIGYVRWAKHVDYSGWDVGLGAGFWLGVLSACLVVSGILLSIMIEIRPSFKPAGFSDRARTIRMLLSWNHTIGQQKNLSEGRRPTPRFVSVLIGTLIVTCVLLAVYSTSLQAHDAIVQEIDGGVIWVVTFPGLPWNRTNVVIGDHSSWAYWDLDNTGLDRGTWSAYTANQTSLSEDNITLTVVDSTGNGVADYGDAVIFMIPGSSFKSGVTYSAFLTTGKPGGINGVGGWQLEFKFRNGHLASYDVSHRYSL